MKTFCFVAVGYEISGSTITFGSPSPGLPGLTTQLRRGDGAALVQALETSGHATDNGNLDVYRSRLAGSPLDWIMKGTDWVQHVIVPEVLVPALLTALCKL